MIPSGAAGFPWLPVEDLTVEWHGGCEESESAQEPIQEALARWETNPDAFARDVRFVALCFAKGRGFRTEDAADAAQETVMRLLREDAMLLRVADPKVGLASFVIGVSRNVCRELTRSHKREPQSLGDLDEHVPDRSLPRDRVIPGENRGDVSSLMGLRLTRAQQDLVCLLTRGRSLVEACDALGVSLDAGLRRLQRAAAKAKRRQAIGVSKSLGLVRHAKTGWSAIEEASQRSAARQSRLWATKLLDQRSDIADMDRIILQGLSEGAFLTEIAERVHLSVEGVRSRVRKLRTPG
jgi:DNA-directed RNA polymerase specialized sigma24 family protein